MSRRVRVVLVALAALVVSLAPTPGRTALGDLTPAERARLERGEVVVLDVLPAGGPAGAQGGTALVFVPARPEAVWRLLVDYPGHAGLYPHVVAAEVLEADAGRTLVRYRVGVGPFSFRFHVHSYPDAAHRRLHWDLAAGRPNDLFRENRGYWQLEPAGEGVVVTYAMASRTVLPAFLTRGAERQALVETLQAVRRRAIGS
ncbi:MAG: type II toxin-antitoxin system RatA family toxin [Candidatus Rokuibacteriota bacterium]